MKKLSLLWITLFIQILAAFFGGCSNFDDQIYDASKQEYIRVNIYTSRAFDSTSVRAKADTIRLGDSLVFISEVFPTRAMRNQASYWTLDDIYFSSEYYFRSTIITPGRHTVRFYLVDFFGDTLSDSISIIAATPPRLDNSIFIPAKGSQNLIPTESINFAWSVKDLDRLWDLSHHFVLKEATSNKILVDSILHDPYFTYNGILQPLTKYEWTVYSKNEAQMVSEDTIYGTLFTQGIQGENAILGKIQLENVKFNTKAQIVVNDSLGNKVTSRSVTISNGLGAFNIGPLQAGSYLIQVSVPEYSDFKHAPQEVVIKEGRVYDLETIKLADKVSPVIKIESVTDTLPYQDTVKVVVIDNGGEIPQNRFKAQLENTLIIGAKLKGDTLYIPLKEVEYSWTQRFLTITVFDQSENMARKTLVIRPNTTLPEAFGE